ncbi:MAG: hypothetical protein KDA81_14560 [Planctomycetaceae bacterium]|nr:hypothetical protein [Planctomycetaceae bacterium]
MSEKCTIRIRFDRPDRTYRGGETISGEVIISVNSDVRCNGITLTRYWKTHGRGNTATGEKVKIPLSEAGPLQTGEELTLPFSFEAERTPLTYRGHYINVDHYVHVNVNVPWAIDPKHEEEYILLPGECPPEYSNGRGDIMLAVGQTAGLSSTGKTALIIFVGLFALLMLPIAFFLSPLILIGGIIYWIRRNMIAARVGEVEFTLPHQVVTNEESLPVQVKFTPRRSFLINGVTLRLMATESATSGSGTNATTHRHTLLDEQHTLHPAGQMFPGEPFIGDYQLNLPKTQAWSLRLPSNVVEWSVEARIDIPRCPDWSMKTVLTMVPAEFLSGTESVSASPSPATWADTESTDIEHTSVQENFRSPVPDSRVGNDGSTDDLASIIALVNQIESAGRFGNERSEIAAATAGHVYDVRLVIDRVATTFGYSGTDERFRQGKTVTGTVEGTDQLVQLFTTSEHEAELNRLKRGDVWYGRVVIDSWDSLYNRLIMLEST